MSLNANALTTVARQKIFMGITSSSFDTRLEMLINSVSAYIEKITNRKFKYQTYTNEVYDGVSSRTLYLNNAPIDQDQPVTLSFRDSGLNEDTWQGVEGSDFFVNYLGGSLSLASINSFESGSIENFQSGYQSWRATYTAGYYLPQDDEFNDEIDPEKDLPADLEQAVMSMVAAGFNTAKTLGVEKSRVRDIEVTYAKTLTQDPMLNSVIMSYRRRVYR